MLSDTQNRDYANQGFLVLEGFKNHEEIARLRDRATQIVNAFDISQHKTIFTTEQQVDHIDQHFLDSATGVSCFFEEEAFDDEGNLQQAKHLSINKIGHAMHDLDPVFSEFSRGPALHELAVDLGMSRPQVWQSMYIFKQPSIGCAVNWHQDATFFYTQPVSVTTFWFALEDAYVSNGCLRVEPGGHTGPLRERFTRDSNGVDLSVIDDTPWAASADAVALEVPAGSLVVFHGLLPHYSEPNRSTQSRHAYTLHATDGHTHYSSKNWIQRDASLPVQGFETIIP